MAAVIKSSSKDDETTESKKPILLDRIDGFECDILAAILLPKEEGFITTTDDKLLSSFD